MTTLHMMRNRDAEHDHEFQDVVYVAHCGDGYAYK